MDDTKGMTKTTQTEAENKAEETIISTVQELKQYLLNTYRFLESSQLEDEETGYFCALMDGYPSLPIASMTYTREYDNETRITFGYDRLKGMDYMDYGFHAFAVIMDYFEDCDPNLVNADEIADAVTEYMDEWMICLMNDDEAWCPDYPDDVVLPCTEADIDRVIREGKDYLEDIYNTLANVLEGRVYDELKKQALKKEQDAGAVFPQMKIVC